MPPTKPMTEERKWLIAKAMTGIASFILCTLAFVLFYYDLLRYGERNWAACAAVLVFGAAAMVLWPKKSDFPSPRG